MSDTTLGSYITALFDGSFSSSNANLGTNIGVTIGGNTPFTIQAWIYVTEGTLGNILSQKDVYAISVTGGLLTVSSPGQPNLTADGAYTMEPGWHFIAVSFNGTSLTLFVDAMAAATGSFTFASSSTTTSHVAGSGFTGRIDAIAVFASARSLNDMDGDVNSEVGNWNAVQYYDFSQSPPVNSAGTAITLGAGATSASLNPVLSISGLGLAAALDPSVNPGGAGSDAYSVLAWINISQPSPFIDTSDEDFNGGQIIFANSDLVGNAGISLYAVPTSTPNTYNIVAQRGQGASAVSVTSSITVQGGDWAYIGMVYDPTATGGPTLTVYVQGTGKSISAATQDALAGPSVGIGGAYGEPLTPAASGSVFDGFDCFQGSIGTLMVFNSALPAATVLNYLTELPLSDTSLVALYTFEGRLAGNMVTGTPVGLIGDAVLSEYIDLVAPSTLEPTSARKGPRGARSGPTGFQDPGSVSETELAGFRSEAEALWSRVDFKTEIEAILEKDLKSVRKFSRSNEAFERDRKHLQKCYSETIEQAVGSPLGGRGDLIMHHSHGEYWILVAHGPEKSTAISKIAKADIDECTLWQITFVGTIIIGLLVALFGIYCNSTALNGFIANALLQGSRSAVFLSLLSVIVAEGVTSTLVFNFFYTVFSSFASEVLSIVISGFALIWALARVLAYIGIQPLGVAVIFAQIGVTLGKIVAALNNRPTGCTFSSSSSLRGTLPTNP